MKIKEALDIFFCSAMEIPFPLSAKERCICCLLSVTHETFMLGLFPEYFTALSSKLRTQASKYIGCNRAGRRDGRGYYNNNRRYVDNRRNNNVNNRRN